MRVLGAGVIVHKVGQPFGSVGHVVVGGEVSIVQRLETGNVAPRRVYGLAGGGKV